MLEMNITTELISFLDKYNGKYGENEYIDTEFRYFYVIKGRNVEKMFGVNRENYSLAQAKKITKELMDILYDDTFICEYTAQISEKQVRPSDSTIKNE